MAHNAKHFFRNVMMSLGYHGWKIKFTTDNYCWEKRKRIDINKNYNGDIKQIILHEIAHIGTSRFCNQKHNPAFWKHLEDITKKFLKTCLDKNQLNHKLYTTNGYYKLCYRSE